MKLAGLFIGLLIAAALLWNAGEKHVENCQARYKLGCNVLPWSGHHPAAAQPTTPAQMRARRAADRERQLLLREACQTAETC